MISRALILSIANALAFALNCLETFGFGPFSSSFSSDQDNGSISQKYQTIITPSGIAFSIWGIIFLAQAVFVVLNLFSEQYRSHPLVVEGVSWWYVVVCIAQTAWSPAFAYEKIPLAAFFMGCILLGLVAIAFGQYKVVTNLVERQSGLKRSDFWLLQFPFEIHLGWIVAAFVLNLNIVVVASGASAGTQCVVAGVFLAVLAVLSGVCLFLLNRPNYTVPWVVVWATGWINFELKNPNQLIVDTFSTDQINDFRIASGVVCGILAGVTLLFWLYTSFVSRSKTPSMTGESGERTALNEGVSAQ